MTQQSLFKPFIAEPLDFKRWSNQRKQLFSLLKDQKRHLREELVRVTNAQNITAVVSEIRHAGGIIKCTRSEGQIYYQLLDIVDESTVKQGIHCATCRCSE
jgi:hypothetical protein